MSDTQPITPTYQSLEGIRQRKAVLLTDIRKESQEIDKLWSSLFHEPVMLKKNVTASQRINSLINTGAGALDAALLVWKLYRKFHRK